MGTRVSLSIGVRRRTLSKSGCFVILKNDAMACADTGFGDVQKAEEGHLEERH